MAKFEMYTIDEQLKEIIQQNFNYNKNIEDTNDLINSFLDNIIYHSQHYTIIQDLGITDFEEAIDEGYTSLMGIALFYLRAHIDVEYYNELEDLNSELVTLNNKIEEIEKLIEYQVDDENELSDLKEQLDEITEKNEDGEYDDEIEAMTQEINDKISEIASQDDDIKSLKTEIEDTIEMLSSDYDVEIDYDVED